MTGTAFALAGLGGFNAHGAGFLDAATAHGMNPKAPRAELPDARPPELVTATSGQIVMLYFWLAGCADLRSKIVRPELEDDPLALVQTAMFGMKGVFSPAYEQAIRRWWAPLSPRTPLWEALVDRLLPVQQYVPTRPDGFFREIAEVFNASTVGVVFNAYDPVRGRAALYGNAAAKPLWPTASRFSQAARAGARDLTRDTRYQSGRGDAELQPIDGEAVRAALWLTLYGFDNLPAGQLDGAYHRACLVSELYRFRRVIVARPLAKGWLRDRLPANYFEMQDWQTEMWFSVGYKAEVDALNRINQLIDDNHLSRDDFNRVDLRAVEPETPAGFFSFFNRVDLRAVEPETPAGFFSFFIERDSVYVDARDKADRLFRELRAGEGWPG